MGCHFLLPDPEIEPGSPALQADSLPTELWGKHDTCLDALCRDDNALPATLLGLSHLIQRQSGDWRTHPASRYSSLPSWWKALTWATDTSSASPGSGWNSLWVEFKLSLRENTFCLISHHGQSSCTNTPYRAVGSWLPGPTLVANKSDIANSLSKKSYEHHHRPAWTSWRQVKSHLNIYTSKLDSAIREAGRRGSFQRRYPKSHRALELVHTMCIGY